MKNKNGYLLLESIVSLIIIVTISFSLYYFLFFCVKYKNSIQDKVELYEQSKEISSQINKVIANSDGIISIENLNGSEEYSDSISYTKIKSIKCKYKNEYRNEKDKQITYKSNKKIFINTLNSYGGSEVGGYEIGDYVDFIAVNIKKNKISIMISLSKNKEHYKTYFTSYIRKI